MGAIAMAHVSAEDLRREGPVDAGMDPALFAAFQAGDPDAMRDIVRLFHRRLIGFLQLFTRSTEIAEEIAQETFLTAWEERTKVSGPAQFKPWLFVLGKRKALREMKRVHYARESCVIDEELVLLAGTDPARQGSGLLSKDTMRQLVEALGQLNDQDRELLTLRYFGELQHQELSRVLEMPMGSVGVKLGRALTKLRGILEQKGLKFEDFVP